MNSIFDFVIIDTPNVKIRPRSHATWDQVAAGILYEGSWHGKMWNITTPEDVQRMHTNALSSFQKKTSNPLVFLNHAETEVLGVTNFLNCEPQNRLLEIGGSWISKKWQRTHVNTETKYALLKYCFEVLNLVRVEFRIDHENHQSQRAIQRLGVQYEGFIRNRRLIPSGEVRDYKFYSVVDRDWPTVKVRIERLMNGDKFGEIAQPRLETERLILEPYCESDLQDIFDYASDPQVSKFVPWEHHKTLDDSRQFLKYVRQSTRSLKGQVFFVWAIRSKESGRVIGSFDFKNTNPLCGQIDYALGVQYWNKGIITEAGAAVKEWALSAFPEMIRFQAFCATENTGSARVMEKLGMQKEGVRRKAFVLKGQPVDVTDYSLTR